MILLLQCGLLGCRFDLQTNDYRQLSRAAVDERTRYEDGKGQTRKDNC